LVSRFFYFKGRIIMKFILGKKIEMARKFMDDGAAIPVTMVEAGPCKIVQIKTEKRDGYKAAVIGFGSKKKIKKSQEGHLKGLENFRFLKEFRLSNDEKHELKRGDEFNVSSFQLGDVVHVAGLSKGKGFAGVVKRHSFSGSPASHGHKDQLRMPGSIGATGPARVFKGVRMGGHMGAKRVTVKNLEIVDIDKEKNLLFIKGAVPGPRNNLLLIYGKGQISVIEDYNREADSEAKDQKETANNINDNNVSSEEGKKDTKKEFVGKKDIEIEDEKESKKIEKEGENKEDGKKNN